jgi:hypothetical protein
MHEQERRLMREYETAVDRYLEAMRTLQSRTPTTSKSEYLELLRQAESAREQANSARRALVEHLSRQLAN